ncbi:MAG: DegT/DnrJ/EryC1/StrS family aminotransferase [Burkholderiales bacterium]
MKNHLKMLAGTLYSGCPPIERQSSSLPEGEFRYFSHGRHALFEALALSGVGKGDTVLLPEYICRDALSAVRALGARAAYYPVDASLKMAASPDTLPGARAIIAVDYFGFPQDLSRFETYCKESGAILIEDNAHGFLSRDEKGKYLGTRGDIGIFSFRKSIPLVNGSGMLVNRPEKFGELPAQLPFVDYPEPRLFGIKKILRRLPGLGLAGLLYALIGLERKMRALRTGSEFVMSGEEAEHALPGSPEPDSRLPGALELLDRECETARRRALYAGIEEIVARLGGIPLFPNLPEHVVPYGFAFRAPPEKIGGIEKMLRGHCLDFHPWPELPSEITQKRCERYESVRLVNFIW